MLKNRIKTINKKAVAIISVLMIIFITYNVFFRNSQAQALSKYGSRGNEVTQIQTKLKRWGYYNGSIDGIYGSQTLAAVKYFQRKNGLTADGIAGTKTLQAMGIYSSSNSTSQSTNNSNVNLLAHVVYSEARGEPYSGQVAVAAVVLNRVKSSKFPNTISGVIYQSGAFDCVSDGQINLSPNATAKKAAQDTFDKIVNKIKEIPGKMLEIGKNIVEGIWDGIKNATKWITDKVKEFAKKILDGIKSALGIKSPSKVFREQVGKNLALGIGEGFTEEMKNVSEQMEKTIPTDFDTDLNTAVNLATSDTSLPIEINRKSVEELRLKNESKDKKNEELLTQILNTARGINESLYGKFVSALVDGVSVSVNDREIARLVRRYA